MIVSEMYQNASYYDSFGEGIDTYGLLFKALQNYHISDDIFMSIIRIFDENIKAIEKMDDHNYKLYYQDQIRTVSDKELVYLLSSGTSELHRQLNYRASDYGASLRSFSGASITPLLLPLGYTATFVTITLLSPDTGISITVPDTALYFLRILYAPTASALYTCPLSW